MLKRNANRSVVSLKDKKMYALFFIFIVIAMLLIWIIGQEFTIRNMRRQIEKAEKDKARFLQRIKERDRFIGEMSHMASRVDSWPSIIER